MKNGRFTKSTTADEMQTQYEEMMDPITAFITECVVTDASGIVSKDDLYQAYHWFCKRKGFTNISKQTLTSELKPRIAGLGESKNLIGGRQQRCWIGIRLLGGTTGTIGTLTSFKLLAGSNNRKVVNGSVPIVPSVPPEDSEAPETPLGGEDQIFVDAIRILRGHGGQMRQQDLFRALAGLGHRLVVADPALRGDDRFVFMGLYVKLSHTDREGAPP
jgi:hypothetical protein